MNNKYEVGDIVWVKLDNEYSIGKVLQVTTGIRIRPYIYRVALLLDETLIYTTEGHMALESPLADALYYHR